MQNDDVLVSAERNSMTSFTCGRDAFSSTSSGIVLTWVLQTGHPLV